MATQDDAAERDFAADEQGQNDGERWVERYLRTHGYTYEYEPDLGVSRRPDFLARRDGVEIVCEVKSFQQPTPLERRISGTNQATMISADEEYGPMRSAVREAARQLRPLAGSRWPLVVVLANPHGYWVNLTLERLVEAMFGNPVIVGRFDPEEGQVEDFRFDYGRDGRLRNDHPYISAVAIVHERDLAYEYVRKWHEERVAREAAKPATLADAAEAARTAVEEWQASEASQNVPEGNVYRLEVLTTGNPDAVPLPDSVFNGPRDERFVVERPAG